ncbi:MAG: sulfoxide reductase heme-binding subunit YedZ [Gemmatimonadota bacterium]|nr:MAG: sulfoxide reductase heme-binding subunit YedZ [Gemmatimonadota bacterium]
MNRARLTAWVIRPTVFVASLTPFALLLWDVFTGNLSANPIEDITHRTGRWGLTLLLATLSITPLVRVTGWSQLMKLRRPLGLFAFFYLACHFGVYIALDQLLSVSDILEDIASRPYVTVGFASFVLLIPLAVTSTKGMVRRLGGKRWARLHRLVYLAAAGGVLHYLWLVKIDKRDPMIYAGVLVVLLLLRLGGRRRKPSGP